MKKLIILLLLIPFIVLALFFLSFSTYSEDDGCVVLLNSFKEGITFDDIVFLQADNAEKCNKNNTLILNTLKGGDVLKFAEPLKRRMGNISFFVSAIIPEKRADDLPLSHGEQREEKKDSQKNEQKTSLRTSLPDPKSDFVIYYLYNDPESAAEDLEDAFTGIQESRVNLILTGNFDAPQKTIIRPQLTIFSSSNKPEAAVLVFSVVKLEDGEKKVIVRSFNRRTL